MTPSGIEPATFWFVAQRLNHCATAAPPFMQGIYTHISETNYVLSEYGDSAILLFLFMVLISLVSALNLLYFYIGTFRSMCAVPNMVVSCISLTSCFPGILFTYFLNDFEIVPVAPIITGITFVFTSHMRCISIVRSLYFRIFSASFLITFMSREIATSVNIHVPFSLSRIIMSGLLLGIVLSVCIWLLLLDISGIRVFRCNFINSSFLTPTCKNSLFNRCVSARTLPCKGVNNFRKYITSLKLILL